MGSRAVVQRARQEKVAIGMTCSGRNLVGGNMACMSCLRRLEDAIVVTARCKTSDSCRADLPARKTLVIPSRCLIPKTRRTQSPARDAVCDQLADRQTRQAISMRPTLLAGSVICPNG